MTRPHFVKDFSTKIFFVLINGHVAWKMALSIFLYLVHILVSFNRPSSLILSCYKKTKHSFDDDVNVGGNPHLSFSRAHWQAWEVCCYGISFISFMVNTKRLFFLKYKKMISVSSGLLHFKRKKIALRFRTKVHIVSMKRFSEYSDE